MKNIIFTIIFIAFSTSTFAETAQLGENQNPPAKSSSGGCAFARAKKRIESATTATKTESKKAKTMDIKGN